MRWRNDENFENILSAAINEAIGDLAAEGKARLKAEYDKLLEGKLSAYKEELGDFDDLTKGFNGNISESNAFNKAVEKKKKEVEAQLSKLSGGLGGKAADEINNLKDKFGL